MTRPKSKFKKDDIVGSRRNRVTTYRVLWSGPRKTRVIVNDSVTYCAYTCPTHLLFKIKGRLP
jgi:hypothetical protein